MKRSEALKYIVAMQGVEEKQRKMNVEEKQGESWGGGGINRVLLKL